MNEWEHLVQRWEVLANDILNDAVKRQILLDMDPAGIRVQLTLAGHSSYEALRSAIMSYLVASRDWNATANPSDTTSTPMEVDALTREERLWQDTEEARRRQSWQDLLRVWQDGTLREGIAGTAKEHPLEGRPTARDRAKERPRAKVAARAMAKVNSVCEERVAHGKWTGSGIVWTM